MVDWHNEIMQGPKISIRMRRNLPAVAAPIKCEQLDECVPLTRPFADERTGPKVTYREYLVSVQRFVINHWGLLMEILSEQGFPAVIKSVDIVAEKHGADYHPARVEVRARGARAYFTVNVAVSDRGRTRLEGEFNTARLLHEKFRTDFIPKAYCLNQERVNHADNDDTSALMLLAEWFDGYHEFHLSVDKGDGSAGISLWDRDSGHRVLSAEESGMIYHKAASILTYFYDVETFEEIFPWHHAAGDFVVRQANGAIDVKLVATRQYTARVGFPKSTPQNRIMALLMFLTNLTVRMRLDRLDGVGEVVWAEDSCVDNSIRGFLEAMKKKIGDGHCDRMMWSEFLGTLKNFSPVELAQIFRTVVGSYHTAAPDLPVIENNLADHVFRVYKALQILPQSVD
jgi:hypothetical protein